MLDFSARQWGDMASLVGLVIQCIHASVCQARFEGSRRGSGFRVASDAQTGNGSMRRLATDIEAFVALGQSDCASLRARDLMHQIAFLDARWEMKLPERSKSNVSAAHEQLEHIHRETSRLPVAAMTPRARTLLTRACLEVSTIFIICRERGAATAEAEREA
jgi:hypothetical protein